MIRPTLQATLLLALTVLISEAGFGQGQRYRYAEIVTGRFVGLPFNTSAAVDSGQVEIIITRSGRRREVRHLDYDYPSVSAAMNALALMGWEYVEAVALASDDAHQLRWVIRRPMSPAELGTLGMPGSIPGRTQKAGPNR